MSNCTALREHSGSEEKPLSILIGVALSDPGDDTALKELVAQADEAMYDVKRGGKGAYAMSQTRAGRAASEDD